MKNRASKLGLARRLTNQAQLNTKIGESYLQKAYALFAEAKSQEQQAHQLRKECIRPTILTAREEKDSSLKTVAKAKREEIRLFKSLAKMVGTELAETFRAQLRRQAA